MRQRCLGNARGHGQRSLFQNADNLGHADMPDAVAVERYRMGPGLVRSHTHRLGDSRN